MPILAHLDGPSSRVPKSGETRVISPGYVSRALDLELQAGYSCYRYLNVVTLWSMSVRIPQPCSLLSRLKRREGRLVGVTYSYNLCREFLLEVHDHACWG